MWATCLSRPLASGASPEQTTRCAYWSVAALCLIPMLIVGFGLKPGVPAQLQKREPLLTTARIVHYRMLGCEDLQGWPEICAITGALIYFGQ